MPHPLESNTQSGRLPKNYEVEFKIEVHARNAEEAAKIARDMLLDVDTPLSCDVRKLYWCEEAEQLLPEENEGTTVYFGDRWTPWRWKPYQGPDVTPSDSIAYHRVKL